MTDSSPPGRTVLIVLHGEEVGGASLSVLRLAPELQRLGWHPVFWAPRPSELFDEIRSRGLQAYGAPRPLAGYSWQALRVAPGPLRRAARAPRYFGELLRTIRSTRPAVIHCNSMYTLAEAGIARCCRVPTVLHVHEMIRDTRKHRLARRLLHATGDVVVGVSGASVASLSTARHSARLVYEAAEVPAQLPRRPAAERTVVGTIGVIARRKGTDVFVEAARLVAEATDGVEFRLVGAATDPLDRDWAVEVLARARTSGIEYAERADVPSSLASWDAFALPSRTDPFPIVVLEAMASGLPVIGARVDGIAEQLTSETGILIEGDDPAALAEAILSLHRDRAMRSRLGAAGRARVIARFSLPRQAEGLAEAYAAAIG